MSREIKVRAKVIEDFHTDSQICEAGEWVEGFYTKSLEGYDAICCQMQMECGGIGSGLVWVYIPIDINTLGEFTGLKDKNGKEIYEGDCLKIWDNEEDVKKVIFKQGCFWIDEWHNYGENRLFCWTLGDTSEPQEHIEIIGNIYENPELMGGAK